VGYGTVAVSNNGNQTSVVSSASSVTILGINTSRVGFVVYNDSTQILFLLIANTVAGSAVSAASSTNYTVQVASQGYFESPVNFVYTGPVFGIWAAANGNARITEYS